MLYHNSKSIIISNELAQYGEFDFTLNEWFLFLYAIKQNKERTVPKKRIIEISEFKRIFGLSSYSAIRNAALSLANKKIVFKDTYIKLFSECTVSKKEISFTIDDELLPYLFFGNGNKTIIYVGFLKELRSKHSIRLYLFVSSFRHFNIYRMRIKDTMHVFGFKDKFKSDFIRTVLQPGKLDINNKTDLMCTFSEKEELFSFYCRLKNDEELSLISEDWKTYTLEKEMELYEATLSEEFFI